MSAAQHRENARVHAKMAVEILERPGVGSDAAIRAGVHTQLAQAEAAMAQAETLQRIHGLLSSGIRVFLGRTF